jgi:hypothetical protein
MRAWETDHVTTTIVIDRKKRERGNYHNDLPGAAAQIPNLHISELGDKKMSSILKGLILVGLLLFAYFNCLSNLKHNYFKAQRSLKRTSEYYVHCHEQCFNQREVNLAFDYITCKIECNEHFRRIFE